MHSNDPGDDFSSDHDRIIAIKNSLDKAWDEINNLRGWRHDNASPVITTIQLQQRANTEAIGRLTANVDALAEKMHPLVGMPVELAQHRQEAADARLELKGDVSKLQSTVEQNRISGAAGQMRIIWTIGIIVVSALCAIITAQWALVLPLVKTHL